MKAVARQVKPKRRPAIWLLAVGMALLLSLPAQAREAPESFSAVVKGLLPAVVNISTTQQVAGPESQVPSGSPLEEFFRDFFGDRMPEGRARRVSALGSGFIVDPAGYVVTNNHVIAQAEEIRVILADGRSFEASVVGTDPATDLALVKVGAAEPLPAVSWGDSDRSEIGDWLVAIGNPFGLGSTVTAGVLSARARDIQAGPYDDFLQTDAAINRGNSGGPLFDMSGSVVGVNTVILSPTGGNIGIGFAIPASTAKPIVDQLRKHGVVRRGWLGIEIQAVTEEIAAATALGRPRGALVADVVADGPAQEAGVKPGDIILSFNGREVEQVRDLPRIVANTEVAKTVDVALWRDGRERRLQATVAAREGERMAQLPGGQQDGQPASAATLGLELAPLDQAMHNRLGLPEDVFGIVVTAVRPDSAAAAQGIRPGDVIASVNNKPVSTPQQFAERIEQARNQGRSAAMLRINRQGSYRFIAVPV